MAIIGTFTKNGAVYEGAIETLALRGNVRIEPQEKRNANGPDHRVFHVTGTASSEIGGAWAKTSRKGAEYLSLSIDDPSFTEPLNCRLVKTGSEHGYTLYWERQRPRD